MVGRCTLRIAHHSGVLSDAMRGEDDDDDEPACTCTCNHNNRRKSRESIVKNDTASVCNVHPCFAYTCVHEAVTHILCTQVPIGTAKTPTREDAGTVACTPFVLPSKPSRPTATCPPIMEDGLCSRGEKTGRLTSIVTGINTSMDLGI